MILGRGRPRSQAPRPSANHRTVPSSPRRHPVGALRPEQRVAALDHAAAATLSGPPLVLRHYPHAMTRAFHLSETHHAVTSARLRRTPAARVTRSQQFVDASDDAPRRPCHAMTARTPAQVRLRPLRPAARVVPPRLHHRVGGEAVADDVHAQRAREHALAPLAAEVPVVGDLVVVADHVRRHVGQRAAHARQAGAEAACVPLEAVSRPQLALQPFHALAEEPVHLLALRRSGPERLPGSSPGSPLPASTLSSDRPAVLHVS